MRTMSYEMFRLLNQNRPINEGLVKRLMESIKKIGYLPGRPVIVTQEMFVVDGQHRLEACRRLKVPVSYEITHHEPNDVMMALNANQEIWRLDEYVHYWAENGVECYKVLRDFDAEFKMGMSNSISICSGPQRASSKLIRAGGEFKVNPDMYLVMKFLDECRPFLAFWKTVPFVRAVTALYGRAGANAAKKVLTKIHPLKQQVKEVDYLSFFENVLNRRKRKDSDIIRLT